MYIQRRYINCSIPNTIIIKSHFTVDDGAIVDIILDNFVYGPPSGFQKIMVEQSLL